MRVLETRGSGDPSSPARPRPLLSLPFPRWSAPAPPSPPHPIASPLLSLLAGVDPATRPRCGRRRRDGYVRLSVRSRTGGGALHLKNTMGKMLCSTSAPEVTARRRGMPSTATTVMATAPFSSVSRLLPLFPPPPCPAGPHAARRPRSPRDPRRPRFNPPGDASLACDARRRKGYGGRGNASRLQPRARPQGRGSSPDAPRTSCSSFGCPAMRTTAPTPEHPPPPVPHATLRLSCCSPIHLDSICGGGGDVGSRDSICCGGGHTLPLFLLSVLSFILSFLCVEG
jgi:hypothetical protein